jgi:hypothetical protein
MLAAVTWPVSMRWISPVGIEGILAAVLARLDGVAGRAAVDELAAVLAHLAAVALAAPGGHPLPAVGVLAAPGTGNRGNREPVAPRPGGRGQARRGHRGHSRRRWPGSMDVAGLAAVT